MNATTNQQQMQPPGQPMQGQQPQQPDPTKSANQAAANLGFVNTMQEHLLKHKAPKQAPQAQQPQQQPAKQPEAKPDAKETPKEDKNEPNMAEELTSFKKEIEGLLDSKLGDLKREIESALQEEDAKEEQTTKTA